MRTKLKWIIFGLFCMAMAPSAKLQAQNDFLITSPQSDTIERFDAATGDYLGAFVTAGSGGLDNPGGVAVGPDGNVYVNSSLTQQVLRYDGGTGDFIDVFASGNGIVANNNIQFHGDYMYIGQFASGSNGLIKRFNAITGAFVDNFISSNFVDGFEFGSDSIYVSDFSGGVGRYDLSSGAFIEQFVADGEGGLDRPTALLLLDSGELLVSSYGTDSVKRYSFDGTYLGEAISNLVDPEGLAIGPNGNLYAGSSSLGIVNEYDSQDFSFVSEFANSGPVTNFFTFRTNAVPEPTATLPLMACFLVSRLRRRRQRT